MICPYCHKQMPDELIARHFASIGGLKSTRTWTEKQKKAMVKTRRENEKKRAD